jgi:uncharacterized protein YjhX (UPF0386 family)
LYPINVSHREGYFHEEKDQHESHEVLEFESLGLTYFNFRYLCFYKDGEGGSGTGGGHGSVFWHEMMSRPVHAVARGSNVAMLKELIEQCSNVSWYLDIHGGARPRHVAEVLDELLGREGGSGTGSGHSSVFRHEMMSRAVHAMARGGNVAMLKDLIERRSDVSWYLDVRGSTVLHAAAGRGQLLVKHLHLPTILLNYTC